MGENWQITNGVVHRPANEEERAGPQPSSASERLQENEVEPPNQLEGRESEMEMMPDMGGPRMVDGHIVVNLPIAATRAEPIDGGAIIMTSFGLVAIDTGGSIRWRLTEVSDFVVSGDWLIVTTPWGVRGHRIPPPIQQTQPGGSH